MSAKVSVKDHGLAKLREDLAALQRLTVVAGVQEPESGKPHTDSGLTIGEVAALMEYGSDDGHTPARPFLRHTAEVSADRNRERIRKAVSDVVDGRMTPDAAMTAVGREFAGEIVESIDRAREWAEPNAPSTVARKGHDAPLIESETLRESITYAVMDGSRVVAKGNAVDG